MKILDCYIDTVEYIVKDEPEVCNKSMGYILNKPLERVLEEHLFKTINEKQARNIGYYDKWGNLQYGHDHRKFFIHTIFPNNRSQKMDISFDIAEAFYYHDDELTLNFYIKDEDGCIFNSFKYRHAYGILRYVLNKDGDLVGAVIKDSHIYDALNSENESSCDHDIYENEYDLYHTYDIDDFMIENGYDPAYDTIEDMYGLD